MQILIEAPFTIGDADRATIESKVNHLTTYWEKIEQASVFFKKDDGQLVDGILAEVRLHIPGPDIFASDTAVHYLAALDGAINKVERQLRKYKEVKREHQKDKNPIFWSPKESI